VLQYQYIELLQYEFEQQRLCYLDYYDPCSSFYHYRNVLLNHNRALHDVHYANHKQQFLYYNLQQLRIFEGYCSINGDFSLDDLQLDHCAIRLFKLMMS